MSALIGFCKYYVYAVTFDRFPPFLSNKIETLRQIALKNKQLKEFSKKWKNFV